MLKMDYSALVTAVSAQVTLALAAVIPLVGVILGATVGYKFIRRFI
jgi:hypothetical protein